MTKPDVTPEELIARTRELDALRRHAPSLGCLLSAKRELQDLAPALADALEAERAKVKVAREALKVADARLHEIAGTYMAIEYGNAESELIKAIREMGDDMDTVRKALTKLDQ